MRLAREPVRENPTRWKMIEPHIGYLRLLEFSEEMSSDVSRSVTGLVEAGARALPLPLRGDGGGLVVAGAAGPRGVSSRRGAAPEEQPRALTAPVVHPQAPPAPRPG